MLERCILMTTDPGDLVLDLTCGSGAMPYQAEKWGRRWVSVDVAQVSIAITRERLITNTYPYHMLKDSPEGARRGPRNGAGTTAARAKRAIQGTASRQPIAMIRPRVL